MINNGDVCVLGGGDAKVLCVEVAWNDMDAEVTLIISRISYWESIITGSG